MDQRRAQQPSNLLRVSEAISDFAERYAALETRLGYSFANRELLLEALTHSSFARDPGPRLSDQTWLYNERLEFLGDVVLSLSVSTRLITSETRHNEGELSKARASIVNSRVLADVARGLQLGQCLLLSRAEDKAGGREKESILADALEAVFGAVYLDAGFATADQIVHQLVSLHASEFGVGGPDDDFKTALQEVTQKLFKMVPTYETIVEAGPAHNMSFQVAVSLGGKVLGTGEGSTKKRASQAAARIALELVRAHDSEKRETDD